MDTHSHQADLIALSKLYWLVQVNDPGSQSLVTKVLDEASSIFLRKLLDDVADKIYKNITKKVGQLEDHLETLNGSGTSSPNKVPHKKVLEEKALEVEHPRVVNDAMERIASLIPNLEHLANPYSNKPASPSASSYEKTTSSTTTRRCSDDFSLSSATQFGTSSSTTTSHSSFGSYFDHGDDELSPSEYYQSRQRSHKKMGKLGRLKDKLGSIFHHHHHHHHHHHGQHPRDKSVEASGSLGKKYAKMFKSNEKRVEGKLERQYMKVETKVQKRPKISRGQHERRNKQQGGYIQEPIGGLKRNIKNLNKPKQGGQRTNCKATRNPGDKLQQRRKELRLRQKY